MGKADQTKKNIIIKAAEILAKKGFAGTTTKEIAEASGVAEGTLFKYYKTKDNLLKVIITQLVERLKEESFETIRKNIESREDVSATEKLFLLYEERMAFFKRHNDVVRVLLQELTINPHVKDLFNTVIVPTMYDITNSIMESGKNSGEFKDLKTEVMTIGFVQLMLAPFMSEYMFSGLLNEQVEDHHRELIGIYVDGLRS